MRYITLVMSLPSESPESAEAGPETIPGVFEILRPAERSLPVVFASPHSGNAYAEDFVAASRLALPRLRKSEDSFVDELFGAAPAHGAPLIRALFPRAYVDPNREPFELDPEMFTGPLPAYVNTHSSRVAAGLGTIARVVASGEEIYRCKLAFAEAARRVEALYRPYHRALRDLIAETHAQFGWCLLVDCHSMPSVGGPMDQDSGKNRMDFVLGDCFGASCDPRITEHIEGALAAMGHTVTRNLPYSGGYTTVNYGRPGTGVHAVQIEINRGLYMDEDNYVPLPGMARLKAELTSVIAALPALCACMRAGA